MSIDSIQLWLLSQGTAWVYSSLSDCIYARYSHRTNRSINISFKRNGRRYLWRAQSRCVVVVVVVMRKRLPCSLFIRILAVVTIFFSHFFPRSTLHAVSIFSIHFPPISYAVTSAWARARTVFPTCFLAASENGTMTAVNFTRSGRTHVAWRCAFK